MRRFFSSISAFLLLASICLLPVSMGFAKSGPSSAHGSHSHRVIRDSYTELELLPDGTHKLRSYAEPAFYQDTDGNWRPISSRIQRSNAESFSWENTTGIYHTWYPSQPGEKGLLTRFNGVELEEWINPGLGYRVGNQDFRKTSFLNAENVQVNGSQLLYKEVAPGVTVEFLQQNSRRKMNVHLADRSALNGIPASASHLITYETWKLPEGMSLRIVGDKIHLVDPVGKPLAAVEKPEIFEAGSESASITGSWTLEQQGNLWTIGLACPMEWLQASSRQFPVVIDPTINFTAFNTSLATGYLTTAAGTPVSGDLRMGGNGTFAFAKFDISTLPYNASISSVTFYGFHYSGSMATQKVVRLNALEDVDPTTSTGTQISTQINLNNSYNASYVFAQTSASYGWKSGVLGGTIVQDLVFRSITHGWLGIGMNWVSGSNTTGLQYAYNGLNPPYLEVVYTTTGHSVDGPGGSNLPAFQFQSMWRKQSFVCPDSQ